MFFFLADPQGENFLDSNNHHSQLLISFVSKYTGIMKFISLSPLEFHSRMSHSFMRIGIYVSLDAVHW